MRIRLFLLVTLLNAATATINAQKNMPSSKNLTFGARVGLHYGLVKTNQVYFNGIGFRLGGFSDLRISEKSAIRIDLNGSFENNYARDHGDFFGIDFTYLEVSKPVFFEYSIFYTRNFLDKISLLIGPNLEHLINGNNTKTVTWNGEKTVTNTTLTQRLYLGVGIGANYQCTNHLYFGFLFSKNVLQFSSPSLIDNRNRFQLSLSYNFT